MKFKYFLIVSFYLLCMIILSSCGKENVDVTTVEEEDITMVVSCSLEVNVEENSGLLTTSVTDGTVPYTYSWSTGETTSNINVATGGDYSVTITDAEGCIVSDTITVLNNNSCNTLDAYIEEYPGVLAPNVSGGTAPYTYSWSTGETSSSINPIVLGAHTVTITDAEGCTVVASFFVSDLCYFLTANIVESPNTLTAEASGGPIPYTYSWSTGEITSYITIVADGDYSVTVTDADGCTVSDSITVIGTTPCGSFGASVGENSGVLSTNVTGGAIPYAYLWSTGETSSNISPASNGVYSVTITDAQGCMTTSGFNYIVTLVPCQTQIFENSGTLSTLTTGGTPPYLYLWSTGETMNNIQVTMAGLYSVTITDAGGCVASNFYLY